MDRRYLFVGVFVVVVIALVIGAALYTGMVQIPGNDSDEDVEEVPTVNDSDADSETPVNDSEDDSETPVSDSDPFSFTVNEIEKCGETCRDVDVTLENDRNETAADVTVSSRIFAGENNTDTNDIVWEGTEAIGSMAPGESYSTTQRVDLSLQDAGKILQEDGWITIRTTVESAETTVTFQDSEKVA